MMPASTTEPSPPEAPTSTEAAASKGKAKGAITSETASTAEESTAKPREASGTAGKSSAKATSSQANPAEATQAAGAPSGAELKKQAKAEKAARRAQLTQQRQGGVAPATSNAGAAAVPATNAQDAARASNQSRRRAGSGTVDRRQLPVRGGSAQQVPAVPAVPKAEDKTVEFYRHLYRPRATSILGASKEVHPAVLALGLQMSNYSVCGSCARLVATMHAFKKVIQSYTTPAGNTLTRHLTSHVLSPQIDFLASCRPISISMGNAIRWLKLEISKVDIDLPDVEAKQDLCDAIDSFVRERVTYADHIITASAADKIENGDVILTFAKSSVVQRAVVKAKKDGRRFRVIVVDSRPLYEGKHLANALVKLGIEVKYCLLNGMTHCMGTVTKVFLGAHAMLSNGRLFSRVGTALVAMEANQVDIPVIVLCETIKFTERVALDSIVHNEVAPPDELVIAGGPLEKWRDVKGLQLCNVMYDVTPAEYIQMIISESGNVPPTSVPVLHRLGNEGQ